jgi:hypothetical protein
MELFIKDLELALEAMKSATAQDLKRSLKVVNEVLDTKIFLPQSLYKVILVRACGVAKSRHCTKESIEIIYKVINTDFINWIYENNSESNMACTILLSAIVLNIERNDSYIKKTSWKMLEKSCGSIADNLIQACFPGMLKVILEEIKIYRCQGLGSSKVSVNCALKCFKRLLNELSKLNSDWHTMALSRSGVAIRNIRDDIVDIYRLGYLIDKKSMLECLHPVYTLDPDHNKNIISDIISLCVDLDHTLSIDFPVIDLQQLFLHQISALPSLKTLEKKLLSIKTTQMHLKLLGSNAISLFSIHSKEISDILYTLIQFSNLNYSELNYLKLLEYPEADPDCYKAFMSLIKSLLQHEIFDSIFLDQQNLLRKIRKDVSTESIKKLLIISVLFSEVYIESSLHILNELIFLKIPDPRTQTVSKILFLYITSQLYQQNSISTLESIENILFAQSPETETQCADFFKTICEKNNLKSTQDLFLSNKSELKSSLILKLKIFGIENIYPGLLYYLSITNNINTICEVIQESLKIYDKYYSSYAPNELVTYIKYFSLLIHQIGLYKTASKNQIESGNVVRSILMRTKSLLCLKSSVLDNRKVILSCLNLFSDCIDILSNVPLEIDNADCSPFALEEESNVSIPNALPEICYEYFGAFIYCLRSMADSNCIGISICLVDLFYKIAAHQKDFFDTDNRFSVSIFPYLKVILKSNNYTSAFHIKLKIKILEFIKTLGPWSLSPVSKDIQECCDHLFLSPIPEIRASTKSLINIIKSI